MALCLYCSLSPIFVSTRDFKRLKLGFCDSVNVLIKLFFSCVCERIKGTKSMLTEKSFLKGMLH